MGINPRRESGGVVVMFVVSHKLSVSNLKISIISATEVVQNHRKHEGVVAYSAIRVHIAEVR